MTVCSLSLPFLPISKVRHQLLWNGRKHRPHKERGFHRPPGEAESTSRDEPRARRASRVGCIASLLYVSGSSGAQFDERAERLQDSADVVTSITADAN